MAGIELEHVNLTFRFRPQKAVTLKEYLLKQFLRRGTNPEVEVHALQDVSFKVARGERLGIIGHNGAGKSTLLKLIAGVYPPSSGRRSVEGRICSLFDIALGFESEASGWENIGYRCYLQGETPRSVKKRMNEIAEFSELGKFLDMPVRFYSAGMMVRLAFSIATAIEPEVLLIDEALAAGDLSFQDKAKRRMQEFIAKAHLMVLVSHDTDSIRELCDRIVWMCNGRIVRQGDPDEVIEAYKESAKTQKLAA